MTYPKPRPMWELEREAILDALRWSGGDTAKAAVALEMGRTSLYRKIHDYEIPLGAWSARYRTVGQ